MPVIRIYDGCPEPRESRVPGQPGTDGVKKCGRPIYLNGVCDQCYRCKAQLREGGYNPMRATGGVAEQLGRGAYERLYIEDGTLIAKGIERDVEMAMHNLEDELRELLGE